jgi:hypothetical protein
MRHRNRRPRDRRHPKNVRQGEHRAPVGDRGSGSALCHFLRKFVGLPGARIELRYRPAEVAVKAWSTAMRVSVFAVVLLIVTAAPTLAGTVMTSEASTPKISGKVVLYIEPDRLRVETSDYVSIFRADQDTAYLLKPADRKFVRLTSEQLKQLADAPALLRETLKSMSPEQRARFDEHLKSLPPAQRADVERIIAGQAPKFEFRDTGATASFGKWRCEQIDKLEDGQPHESLCVVRASDLGLTEGDVGSLQRFNDFMGQGLPQELGAFSTMDRRAVVKLVGYAAHPVHTEIPTAKMQITLENVEKKPLSPDLFEIPAGYEEDSKLATH